MMMMMIMMMSEEEEDDDDDDDEGDDDDGCDSCDNDDDYLDTSLQYGISQVDSLLGREGSTQTCTWELERKLTHLILMMMLHTQREKELVIV